MKIELQLTTEQIIFLNAVVNSFVDDHKSKWTAMPRKEKAAYSIAVDVADKLHTKARTVARKAKSGKPIKMSFKYHEAQGINYFVSTLKDHEGDAYFRSVALNIYIKLDQKLA